MEFIVYNRNDEYMGLVTSDLLELILPVLNTNEMYIEEFEGIENGND